MTKGISTSERINKHGSRGRHVRLISDGLTSPPRWAADGQGEDPQRFFPRAGTGEGVAAHRGRRRTAGKMIGGKYR
jgi:hypothetical protein